MAVLDAFRLNDGIVDAGCLVRPKLPVRRRSSTTGHIGGQCRVSRGTTPVCIKRRNVPKGKAHRIEEVDCLCVRLKVVPPSKIPECPRFPRFFWILLVPMVSVRGGNCSVDSIPGAWKQQ